MGYRVVQIQPPTPPGQAFQDLIAAFEKIGEALAQIPAAQEFFLPALVSLHGQMVSAHLGPGDIYTVMLNEQSYTIDHEEFLAARKILGDQLHPAKRFWPEIQADVQKATEALEQVQRRVKTQKLGSQPFWTEDHSKHGGMQQRIKRRR